MEAVHHRKWIAVKVEVARRLSSRDLLSRISLGASGLLAIRTVVTAYLWHERFLLSKKTYASRVRVSASRCRSKCSEWSHYSRESRPPSARHRSGRFPRRASRRDIVRE